MKTRQKFLLATLALVATAFAFSSFTMTTSDPNKVQVVTSDVTNFWRAFDDAAKAARLFRDFGLRGGHDVHDDAALEHLGQAGLKTQRRNVSHKMGSARVLVAVMIV